MTSHTERLEQARLSLEGLSVGDAFGDCFFMYAPTAQALIQSRTLPPSPWPFTDDTNMALSIYHTLLHHHEINQPKLAASFGRHYDPARGYGAAMHRLLTQFSVGHPWQTAASALFEGQGSYGNGAAMRIAPLGAYFADDLDQVIEQARKSAEVTHTHPEGISGAIAVALAAALAVRLRGERPPKRAEFLDMVLPLVPDSEVKSGIARARDIRSHVVSDVIGMIGNGYRISAQDTVPFTLWCVGESLSDYEKAMWLTVSGLGDIDTNCAIVGGIVALYVGHEGIPKPWIQHREPLPAWVFS